jgi:MFS family permease
VLSAYAEVLRLPGAAAFSAAAFVARFPISMLGIGMVLLVADRTGSYGLAGAVSAAALLAEALAGPLQARAADLWGQRRVLLPLVAVHVGSVAGFLAAVWTGAARGWVFATAAVAGASLPQVGAFVRARWAALVGGTARLQPAYALESVLDEVIFIGGPVLATLLATGVHPLAGLGTTLLLTSSGGLVLASLTATQPPIRPRAVDGVRPPLGAGRLASVAVAFVFMGAVFGTVEVATVAFTDLSGQPGAAGFVLAVFAAGSLVAGVVAGTVVWRRSPAVRFLLGQVTLAVAVAATALAPSAPVLAAVLFVAGLAIAPTLITGFSMVAESAPASRLTEALAWINTSLAVGVALGAATAGFLVDERGTAAAFLSGSGYGALAALAALTAAAVAARRASADAGAAPEPATLAG